MKKKFKKTFAFHNRRALALAEIAEKLQKLCDEDPAESFVSLVQALRFAAAKQWLEALDYATETTDKDRIGITLWMAVRMYILCGSVWMGQLAYSDNKDNLPLTEEWKKKIEHDLEHPKLVK